MPTLLLSWLITLLTAAVLIAVGQVLAVTSAELLPWWVNLAAVLFFTPALAACTAVATRRAPDRTLAAVLTICLFVILESTTLRVRWTDMELQVLLIRLYADVVLIIGAVLGVTYPSSSDAEPRSPFGEIFAHQRQSSRRLSRWISFYSAGGFLLFNGGVLALFSWEALAFAALAWFLLAPAIGDLAFVQQRWLGKVLATQSLRAVRPEPVVLVYLGVQVAFAVVLTGLTHDLIFDPSLIFGSLQQPMITRLP